ncbi:MAG: dihydrofolate reductase [Deltaproteobacteria bacterium]|nr:dihydrofolate reductase [Deltaproteobacteria bacterium]
MTVKIIAIVAMDESRVIGIAGGLPWKLPEDMKRFAALTSGHTVVMGRKTYESLPEKFRPLPKRLNVVFTRKVESFPVCSSVEAWTNPEDFFKACRGASIALPSNLVWVIGGAEIYAASMPFWDELYLTRVSSKHNGDAYFPPFEEDFEQVEVEQRVGYSFERFVRKNRTVRP